jgi:xanthine dehydrogenase accessory factor
MKGAGALFDFLINASERGERTALVTITDVTGSASRAPGTHMAVSETGAFQGSFSGGCVEAAVVGEAKRVIAGGKAELIRFGIGSRYLDIRLPCGGGLDFLVTPNPSIGMIGQARYLLQERFSVLLALGHDGSVSAAQAGTGCRSGWEDDVFRVRHDPELRLVIVGHGAETQALATLARGYGAEVAVLSPDTAIVEAVAACGAAAWHLKTAARTPLLRTDKHTAVVMLFHDHDWEDELLAQALEQNAFFVGAMGSRATHARRLARLERQGVPASSLARLVGPIGLIPATRDPDTLALSALSQIVGLYREAVLIAPNPTPRIGC